MRKRKLQSKLQKRILKKRIEKFRNSAKTNTKAFYRAMLGKGQKEEINNLLDQETGEMYYDEENKARILKREWEKIYKTREGSIKAGLMPGELKQGQKWVKK